MFWNKECENCKYLLSELRSALGDNHLDMMNLKEKCNILNMDLQNLIGKVDKLKNSSRQRPVKVITLPEDNHQAKRKYVKKAKS